MAPKNEKVDDNRHQPMGNLIPLNIVSVKKKIFRENPSISKILADYKPGFMNRILVPFIVMFILDPRSGIRVFGPTQNNYLKAKIIVCNISVGILVSL